MVIILAIIAIIGLGYLIYYSNSLEEKNIYIHPKTGHQYKALYRCKVKLTSQSTWVDALIYVGLKDGELYVRERKDFFNKFINLKVYKNENKER